MGVSSAVGTPSKSITRWFPEDPDVASRELRILVGDNLLCVATEGVPIRRHGVRLPAMSVSYLDVEADVVLDPHASPPTNW